MGIYTKVATDGGKWVEIGASGGGADLVGGVAGWAAIESVTGSVDLQDLKDAGIAPESATEDAECPGTYNITADGVVWRVAVWNDADNNGSITTTAGLIEGVLISGGAAGAGTYGQPASQGLPSWNNGLYELPDGAKDVVVGKRGVINSGGVHANAQSTGDPSLVGTWSSGTSGAGGGPLTLTNSISGLPVEYGAGGTEGSGGGFTGSGNATYGKNGIVVVRAPKDAENNPKPDVSMPWGDFTTNGDEDASGEWGPDGEGRTWKWAEWNDASKTPTVNLTGGLYWVLTVGGGDAGYSAADVNVSQGQPGLVNEGMWEFGPGETPITIGAKASVSNSLTERGFPSFIGSYGNQGAVSYGHAGVGRGTPLGDAPTGYKSLITGSEQEYAPGNTGQDRPGRAGRDTGEQNDGCVIIATVTNDPSEWNPPGALPGVGGWATITGVTGTTGNRYTYNDDDGDWVAYEFTADGSVATSGGIVDVLISSGGGGWGTYYGHGGRLEIGTTKIDGTTHDVIVGRGGNNNIPQSHSESSSLGVIRCGPINADTLERHACGAGGANYDGGNKTCHAGVFSAITGTNLEYAAAAVGTGWRENSGMGGRPTDNEGGNGKGANGVVIVRVPAANALATIPETWGDL